ncbi:MAG TPA: RDD family protein, partial [Acidimicrobiia bacterium]|nr:RDD family protein [Acidimicrobiia bacterium]
MFASLQVTTPEGVTFRHDLAGAGSRCLATAIDFAVYIGALIVSYIVLGLLFAGMAATGIDVSGFIIAFFVVYQFALLWCYRIFFESVRGGSIGYKTMGLTVVTHRGAKPLFWQSAVRGLLWPVEAIFFSIVGFVSIITTKNSQRLADLITGTMVVHRNRDARLGTLQVQDAALDPGAAFRTWELS